MYNTHTVHKQILDNKDDSKLQEMGIDALIAIAEQLRIANLIKALEMGLPIDPNAIVDILAGPNEKGTTQRTAGR